MMRPDFFPAHADIWHSPAKLNLFLHITEQRPDGYHNIQTLFQMLDFGDVLSVEKRSDQLIRCIAPQLTDLSSEDNLVTKAAKRLVGAVSDQQGLDIYLYKQLPEGGGLGGGSSNAATTLLVLNKMLEYQLSSVQLQAIAAELGADVPVFVAGNTAWAEGIGEQLTPVQMPKSSFLVVDTGQKVNTEALFSTKELTRDCDTITIRDFIAEGGQNVFEPLVRERYSKIDSAMHWLGEFAEPRLTGTGGCIYAQFDDQLLAQHVYNSMPSQYRGFVANGVDRSPLMQQIVR